jgi:hypothetical protein
MAYYSAGSNSLYTNEDHHRCLCSRDNAICRFDIERKKIKLLDLHYVTECTEILVNEEENSVILCVEAYEDKEGKMMRVQRFVLGFVF